jgi:hypothetical protein
MEEELGPAEGPQQDGKDQQGPARTSSGKRALHITWDEENLAANESIQAQFAGVTVPEPKTPYHGPSPPDELEDDLRPLALGDGEDDRPLTAFDYVLMANGGGGDYAVGASPPGSGADVDAAGVRGRLRSDSGASGPVGGRAHGARCGGLGELQRGEGGCRDSLLRRWVCGIPIRAGAPHASCRHHAVYQPPPATRS